MNNSIKALLAFYCFFSFITLESKSLDKITSGKIGTGPICGQFSPTGNPIPTASGPRQIAFSPLLSNGTVYLAVTNQGPSLNKNQVSVYNVSSNGALTEVTGTPFTTGSAPFEISFSPELPGHKLFAATANGNDNNVSVFSIDINTGVFTPNPGNTFSSGGVLPVSVAYSPLVNGNLFAAVANQNDNSFSTYSVDTMTGTFIATSSGQSTGAQPALVAYTPFVNNQLFAAITSQNDNRVYVYSVDTTTGQFTFSNSYPTNNNLAFGLAITPLLNNGKIYAAVTNVASNNLTTFSIDPNTGVFTLISDNVPTGQHPFSIAFALVNCNLFAAVANRVDGTISVCTVDQDTGAFTEVTNSPFSVSPTAQPTGISFSPFFANNGIFAATANFGDTTINVFNSHISGPLATLSVNETNVCVGTPVTFTIDIDGAVSPTAEFNNMMLTSFPATVQVTPPLGTTLYQVSNIADANGCICNNGVSNSVEVTARQCATLAVTKCCKNKNGCASFTISVTNTSNVPADPAIITDTLPDVFQFISAGGAPYTVSGQTVTAVVTIPAGETVRFTIFAKQRKYVKNSASVSVVGEIQTTTASCFAKVIDKQALATR